MRFSTLFCLGALLVPAGAAGAAGEKVPKGKEAPPVKKAAAQLGPAVKALKQIEKALGDLPAGAEVEQIQKALARLRETLAKDLRGQVALAESDLEMWRDRAAWSQRMAKKGFRTRAQAEADRARADAAALALERARAELKALGAGKLPRPNR
jgi:hypothetical protein